MRHLKKGGFTLIELLIVVAIIAILAAIAVPNFIEAQIRAKISRVKSDMRAMSVTMESYRVDNNTYVPGTDKSNGGPYRFPGTDPKWGSYLAMLSTPIAYITNPFFQDVFAPNRDKQATQGTSQINSNGVWDFNRYTTFNDAGHAGWSDWGPDNWGVPVTNAAKPSPAIPNNPKAGRATNWYTFWSLGPSSAFYEVNVDGANQRWCWSGTNQGDIWRTHPELLHMFVYDATNGTKSTGHIFRVGGSAAAWVVPPSRRSRRWPTKFSRRE
jgi:prepilin-type N-terminal cleavage/methylation domain-containing protein